MIVFGLLMQIQSQDSSIFINIYSFTVKQTRCAYDCMMHSWLVWFSFQEVVTVFPPKVIPMIGHLHNYNQTFAHEDDFERHCFDDHPTFPKLDVQIIFRV